ncbi:hypothetical protein [Xanthomonas sp. SI]|uniref:hypothetical protein n=1 Tax=Xanthomonas sp. SI TaxID=2724123 RepID=UPI00163A8E4D|nr:hypothetical protein [Xanthomonas sp. SI]
MAGAAGVGAGLSCTLDRRLRLTASTETVVRVRAAITVAAQAKGLSFEPERSER